MYAPDWITLVTEWSGEDGGGVDPHSLTAMATQLLITISKHIQTLASDWFQGIYVWFTVTMSMYEQGMGKRCFCARTDT